MTDKTGVGNLTLHDDLSTAVECRWRGDQIFRYVYRPDAPLSESPKPYFHPLRGLNGALLTDHRPADHPWHHGLSMTLTLVDGHNFWGGPTYITGQGYRDLGNQGLQRHVAWTGQHVQAGVIAELNECLDWLTGEDTLLLTEQRRMIFDFSDTADGYYTFEFSTRLTNRSKAELRLDTYASREDLPGSPYTGLQLRGPTGLLESREGFEPVFWSGGDRLGESGVHAQHAPWLMIVGRNPGQEATTLIFLDDPGNPCYPGMFFVRRASSQVAFSFVGNHTVRLAPDGDLSLKHRIVVGAGAWSRERAGKHILKLGLSDHS